MQNKIRFVVFEGADGTGKSTAADHLCTRPNYVRVDVRKYLNGFPLDGMDPKIAYPMLFSCFENFDPGNVYVLDRFILSDIVYNHVLRGKDIQEFYNSWDTFIEKFDVLPVILDRDPVEHDFEDDKIAMTSSQFNQLIATYGSLARTEAYWIRKLVLGNAPIRKQSGRLQDDIDYAMNKRGLLQLRYTSSNWKFFFSCIALNQVNGNAAARVMAQFFYEYPDVYMVGPSQVNRIARILRPLGLQNIRAERFIQLAGEFAKHPQWASVNYIFSRAEIEAMPGCGKYAADSYMILRRLIRDPAQYTEPMDKELRAYLEGSIVTT